MLLVAMKIVRRDMYFMIGGKDDSLHHRMYIQFFKDDILGVPQCLIRYTDDVR